MYPLLLNTYSGNGEPVKPFSDTQNEFSAFDEIFMLSARDMGESTVKNGDFKGLGLNEVLSRIIPVSKEQDSAPFPVFIKLINTRERMPVKVYPNDEYLVNHGGKKAKKSLIYIVDCDPDAEMVYGFHRAISFDEMKTRVQNGSLSAVCNFVNVQKGDTFFIPAGVVFAIGAGITALEISINNDSEYLISDYGRRDENGHTRPLQINNAIDVINPRKINIRYGNTGDMTLYPFGTVRELGYSDNFKSELIMTDGNLGLYEDDGFVSLIMLSGESDMSYPSGTMHLKPGDSVLIPPNVKIRLSGKCEIVYTKIMY